MKVRLVYSVDIDLPAAKEYFAVDSATEVREELWWKFNPTLGLADEDLISERGAMHT